MARQQRLQEILQRPLCAHRCQFDAAIYHCTISDSDGTVTWSGVTLHGHHNGVEIVIPIPPDLTPLQESVGMARAWKATVSDLHRDEMLASDWPVF